MGNRSQSEVLTVCCYIQTYSGTYIQWYINTVAHTYSGTHTNTQTLSLSLSLTYTRLQKLLDSSNVLYTNALSTSRTKTRSTLSPSHSLSLEVLGQNSQVLLFNSNFFYISHTQKASHKKVNVQKFSTKPKVMLGIIRN